ncbi:acyl-CoA dehydrogenase family protein [Falsibacillus pallidus]|uniref:Acyl-CoA dehydrogenase n=1 Tax=Falsibacillus pallidus TaxID=493781 RepID=A0A370GHU6_9BACI|nr:acyl-CoA dehydrogenase family protein [Falsibacillus pallidus]RDI43227.1 acyl-CoA dehydrogenase [Falsibacillus pallidus]
MQHPYLTDDHIEFRKSFKKFLDKEATPYYDQWEEDRLIPRSFWRKMGDMGFLCPNLPEKYGGSGTDWGYSVVLIEELERVGSGLVGIGLHNEIVVPYLEAYGTEEQKQKWLPGCTDGSIITAIAMTEPGAGSDLANIKTFAQKNGDSYVINGQKTFITNGIQADLILLACKTDLNASHNGISLFLIEEGTAGFSRGRKLNKIGLHSQDTAELFFEDCPVHKDHLLGEPGKGFYYMMEKLQQERLIVAVSAQIAAEEMLRMTVEYVKSRKAFGKSVSKFQNSQFKLAEMATEVEVGRTFVDQLIACHMRGEEVTQKVSMAKWWITDMAKKTAGECLQLHGGYGYMEEYEIARRYRDIPVSAIYAGTNEIMKLIIAKNMGL